MLNHLPTKQSFVIKSSLMKLTKKKGYKTNRLEMMAITKFLKLKQILRKHLTNITPNDRNWKVNQNNSSTKCTNEKKGQHYEQQFMDRPSKNRTIKLYATVINNISKIVEKRRENQAHRPKNSNKNCVLVGRSRYTYKSDYKVWLCINSSKITANNLDENF